MPLMAASVSTLVVSWKEAADRKESVARDALVMPMSRRVQVGRRRSSPVSFFSPASMRVLDSLLGVPELDDVDGGAGEQVGIARVLHPDLAHHLADDDLDVLVVDVNALLTVDLLDLLDQVVVTRRRRPRMRSTSWG